jgi:uncharacterized protein YjdB
MKKIIFIILIMCMTVPITSVWANDNIYPESIKITVKNTVMKIGDTQKIVTNVSPAAASDYTLEFISDKPDVVTAGIGTLIAKSEGSANITAKISGTEISDTIVITVKDKSTSETENDNNNNQEIEIVPRNEIIYVERYREKRITYDILPENVQNIPISFRSLNTSIVTVDEKGYIYGKRKGNTQIELSTKDGQAKAFVKVYVTEDEDTNESSSNLKRINITYDKENIGDSLRIMEKETITLGIDAYPISASDEVKWESLNRNIAIVDNNGNVTGVEEGECKIRAISRIDDTISDTVTIKVTKYMRYPDSISISPTKQSFYETGDTFTFIPAFYPEDTTQKQLHWYVYGGAEIDQNGKLTIKDKGEITVKVYSEDWNKSAEYTFEACYSENHFVKAGECFNIKSDRAVKVCFDGAVNVLSASDNIFAAIDEFGNGETIPLNVSVDNNVVYLTSQNGWNVGETYIFIKENICDIYGNTLGKNIKYKLNVRGV